MRDLERAGRAVVEDPAFPPTPVELIEQRGARRRRRGLQLRAAVALACVVTVVGGAVAFALDRHTTTKPVVTVQPRESSTISEAQMRAHLGDGVPHGWVPVDFGDARIYVPRAWSVTTEGCASEPSPGWIELGASYQGGCMGPADRKPFVQITGAVSPTHSPDPARVVHGYRLYAVGASAAGTYAVPDLATTFHVDGAAAEQVLATLAPSSEFVALNYHAPIPSDWKQVSYAGVSLRVPPTWPAAVRVSPCGPVPADRVVVGTPPSGVFSCGIDTRRFRVSGPSQNGVSIGDPSRPPGRAVARTLVGSGRARILLDRDNLDQALAISVALDDGHVVWVTIGLARDGRVAAAIFDSIRVSGAKTKSVSDVTVAPTTTTASTATTSSTTTTAPTVPTTTGNAPAYVAATSASISGAWAPESVTGYRGPLTVPPLTDRPNLEFATSSTWTGSDGCNDMGGSYALAEDGTFRGTLAGMTAVFCLAGAVPNQTVIATAARAGIAGDQLAFFDASGAVLATYSRVDIAAPSTAIVGTWKPVSIAGYGGSLTDPPTVAPPVVKFTSATDFTASDGCNDTTGSYRLDYDGTFHLGQAVTTAKACEYANGSVPPGTTMPVIPNASVLEHAARVDVHGDSLGFLDANGVVLATYSRVT